MLSPYASRPSADPEILDREISALRYLFDSRLHNESGPAWNDQRRRRLESLRYSRYLREIGDLTRAAHVRHRRDYRSLYDGTKQHVWPHAPLPVTGQRCTAIRGADPIALTIHPAEHEGPPLHDLDLR